MPKARRLPLFSVAPLWPNGMPWVARRVNMGEDAVNAVATRGREKAPPGCCVMQPKSDAAYLKPGEVT
jgi:hypothetical protein